MKKKFKVLFSLSVLSLSLVAAIPSFADSTSEASGGWSESRGYYTNQPSSRGFSVLASSTPDSHVGKRLSHKASDHSGEYDYAAFGATIWNGVYHYTTAQMENTSGTVRTTSGRVYGWDNTAAQSPWYRPGAFENIEARTYWGH
ncbi:hypothetical protein [Paenibacillus zanthoxyli]|uniref:hypothetical protein n=1 Tax=Paenibacillus zanthoxyli TaxID=369399 RepID=UPI0012EBD6A2|nr:hypothetical protein [Paenibacillus zanthoxyli]